jgi:hypothetical protein
MNKIPKFTAPENLTIKGSTVAKMLEKHGHATASALVKLTGRPIKAVLKTIHVLHGQSKIHIGAYEINKRGKASRVWYWGDGDDVREPNPLNHHEIFIPRADEAAAWLRNPI